MPHVIVKLAAGRSEQLKQNLAAELAKAVTSTLHCDEASVSVAIEDVEMTDWTEKVYVPDIKEKPELIYRKPGYDPLR
ncbi:MULTISPECIES: tautomerase family protein [unclassified Sinorhizobium]|uniref:tautomerase family protein n=1 Tax=unclassified Sinorhizobium TaxID=2613772 RepID=UPI00352625EE